MNPRTRNNSDQSNSYNNFSYKPKFVFIADAAIIASNNTLQATLAASCYEAQTGGFIFCGIAYE